MIGGSYILSAMVIGVALVAILLPLSVIVEALYLRRFRK